MWKAAAIGRLDHDWTRSARLYQKSEKPLESRKNLNSRNWRVAGFTNHVEFTLFFILTKLNFYLIIIDMDGDVYQSN